MSCKSKNSSVHCFRRYHPNNGGKADFMHSAIFNWQEKTIAIAIGNYIATTIAICVDCVAIANRGKLL
jgi:hypothetical protein